MAMKYMPQIVQIGVSVLKIWAVKYTVAFSHVT